MDTGLRKIELLDLLRLFRKVTTRPSYLSLMEEGSKPGEVAKVAVGADGAVWIDLPRGRFARFLDSRWEFASTPIAAYFKDPTRSTRNGREVADDLSKLLIIGTSLRSEKNSNVRYPFLSSLFKLKRTAEFPDRETIDFPSTRFRQRCESTRSYNVRNHTPT